MRIAASQISTNYGTAHDDGSVSVFVYRTDGIKELKLGSAHGEMKTDYRGALFIVTDGWVGVQNLRTFLRQHNSENHLPSCGIEMSEEDRASTLLVEPRGGEPYKLCFKIGTILGVKDGLPFEVEFK